MKKSSKALILVLVFIVSSYCSGRLAHKYEMYVEERTVKGDLVVSFLDVGQGDCEVIQLPNDVNILIDAGTNKYSKTLVKKINELGIDYFDVVIATHPHEDHIGGLDTIIYEYGIGCIYMPNKAANTKTFEDVLDAIEYKDIPVKRVIPGDEIMDKENLSLTFVAPNGTDYDDTNNYSVVVRLAYNNRGFLFTGDAEDVSEYEILKAGYDISADVLKVGHHGSSSSTSEDFLKAVDPEYAVIEVGLGNSYGHPHEEVLQSLSDIKVYRTDLDGDVTVVCDGNNIEITTEEDKND